MDWNDKVALITGASSGIGQAVARALAAGGARVALVARSAGPLEALVRELGSARTAAFAVDVTDRAALGALPARVVERFGALHFLVHSAGVNHRGAVGDRTAAELVQILDTNLMAPVLLTHAALPHLAPGSVVVYVASLAGKVPVPHEATYSASKAGLRAFGRALGIEQRDRGGVRVCTVCPGPVETGFLGTDLSLVPDLVLSQPLSTAGEVAGAVLRALEGGAEEIDVPRLSGMLATLGYVSPGLFGLMRAAMERRGARSKRRLLERRVRSGVRDVPR
jgi:short-subunit dehydrogenase